MEEVHVHEFDCSRVTAFVRQVGHLSRLHRV